MIIQDLLLNKQIYLLSHLATKSSLINMRLLIYLGLFVLITAGNALKPEEHWRPAIGKDLSKICACMLLFYLPFH